MPTRRPLPNPKIKASSNHGSESSRPTAWTTPTRRRGCQMSWEMIKDICSVFLSVVATRPQVRNCRFWDRCRVAIWMQLKASLIVLALSILRSGDKSPKLISTVKISLARSSSPSGNNRLPKCPRVSWRRSKQLNSKRRNRWLAYSKLQKESVPARSPAPHLVVRLWDQRNPTNSRGWPNPKRRKTNRSGASMRAQPLINWRQTYSKYWPRAKNR